MIWAELNFSPYIVKIYSYFPVNVSAVAANGGGSGGSGGSGGKMTSNKLKYLTN